MSSTSDGVSEETLQLLLLFVVSSRVFHDKDDMDGSFFFNNEEIVAASWLALVQSAYAMISSIAKVCRGPDCEKLTGTLQHFQRMRPERFKSHFRINQSTFNFVLDQLRSMLDNEDNTRRGRPSVDVDLKVAATIW